MSLLSLEGLTCGTKRLVYGLTSLSPSQGWRFLAVMFYVDCQLDGIWNHLGDKSPTGAFKGVCRL